MRRRRGSHGTFWLPVLPRVQPLPSVPQRRDGAPPCASKAASPTKRQRSRAAAPPAGSCWGSRQPCPRPAHRRHHCPRGGSSPTNRRTLVLTLPSSLPPRRLPACSPGARFLQTQRTHGRRRAGTWGTLPVPCCSSPAGRGTVQISAPGRVPAGSRAAFRVVAPLNTAGFRRLEPANGRKLPRCWNSFSITHETVQMSRWNRKGRMELDMGAQEPCRNRAVAEKQHPAAPGAFPQPITNERTRNQRPQLFIEGNCKDLCSLNNLLGIVAPDELPSRSLPCLRAVCGGCKSRSPTWGTQHPPEREGPRLCLRVFALRTAGNCREHTQMRNVSAFIRGTNGIKRIGSDFPTQQSFSQLT